MQPVSSGSASWLRSRNAARDVSLSVAGVLGRPLYVCTQLKPNGDMCMNVAAMSPLLERAGGHRTFRCKKCPRQNDDEALRMIRLYILVPSRNSSSDHTPLRTKSLHIVVHAPPVGLRWGDAKRPANIIADEAYPIRGCKEFLYSQEGSLAIWECARPFQVARS